MTLNAWNGLPDPKMPAQASTEQELYEQWLDDYTLTYEPNYDERKAAFLAGMQAARRAPAVPHIAEVQDSLVAISAAIAGQDDSAAQSMLRDLLAMLAVAPQPPEAETDDLGIPKSCGKPLCSPSKHHPLCELADHIPAVGQMVAVPETAHASVKAAVHANLGTYRRVMAKRSTEAATVQLPEPDEYQYRTRPTWDEKHPWTEWAKCSKEAAADYERAPLVHDWAYEVRYLYDWHQVRQLLAAQEQPHGQQT